MHKLLAVVVGLVVGAGLLAATAVASGPAAPGKEIIPITCEGLGDIAVSVQRGEESNGVGQIVGAKGHGIPVEFTFTLTDVTTGTVLDTGTETVGGGHAHAKQETIHCTGVFFEGPASEAFGTELPPGVAATDTVRASFEVDVVIRGR